MKPYWKQGSKEREMENESRLDGWKQGSEKHGSWGVEGERKSRKRLRFRVRIIPEAENQGSKERYGGGRQEMGGEMSDVG